MKIKLDKNNIQWGVTAFLVLGAGALVIILGTHLSAIFGAVRMCFSILAPIIYGLFIAYLLNPVVKFLEETVFQDFICEKIEINPSEKIDKIVRLICVVLALVFMATCIYGLLALLVPQLVNSIINLTNSFPRYVTTVRQYMMHLFQNNPELENNAVELFESATAGLENWINNSFLPRLNEVMSSFSSRLLDLLSVLKNFLIGSIISIYFLNGKESFIARGKRFIYAVTGDASMANNILRDLRYVNRTFGGFFIGKIIDSAIIAVICYVCTSILKIPYALLVSVIVGITNIIPFFGPFIGAVPCALLILLVSPLKCLYFILFIIVLQQVDGNLIGPKILSNSTGLSSFMVVVSILVGGGIFGFVGLIIGVPLFAVICQLATNIINGRLRKKQLPEEVEAYMEMDHIDPETRKPAKSSETSGDTQLFHYGVRGRKLEDPDTDDEILPAYTIKKSTVTQEIELFTDEAVIITEEHFETIEDVETNETNDNIHEE